MSRNLPVVSSSRPFIPPRMSVGMKVAIGFISIVGLLIVTGIMLTLSEIMQRLERADQVKVVEAAPQTKTTEQAIRAVANTAPLAYPVPSRDVTAAADLRLPSGAVVQQLMPYQGQIYLLVNVPKEGQRIMILDAQSGAARQDIRLQNGVK